MSELVTKYFNNQAKTFDSIYLNEFPITRGLNSVFRKAIYERFSIAIRESGDITNKTVLDIGCGSGRYMVEYAKLGASKVVGVDFSREMLDLARRLGSISNFTDRLEYLQGDFLELQFNSKFDIVLAMGVFDYIEQPVRFLEKMVRVSQGLVIASFPGKSLVRMHLRRLRYSLRHCPLYFYSETTLHQLAQKAKLTDYKVDFISNSGTGYILVGQVRR